MLISHIKKFIYIKTVKTAGTSVEAFFEPYCLPEDERNREVLHYHDEYVGESGIVGYRGPGAQNSSRRWWNHMPSTKIREQIGSAIWDKYFKFCVVRNPFDKLISAFYFKEYLLTREDGISSELKFKTLSSLKFQREEDFLDSLTYQSQEKRFRNWIVRGGGVNDRNLYLIDGEVCVDYFIRYENLLEGIEYVCHRVNIPFEPDCLPKFKVGNRPSDKMIDEYYDEQCIDIILEKYQFELEYFGYLPPAKFLSKLFFMFRYSGRLLIDSKDTIHAPNETLEESNLRLKEEVKSLKLDVEKHLSEKGVLSEEGVILRDRLSTLEEQSSILREELEHSKLSLSRTQRRLRRIVKRRNATLRNLRRRIRRLRAELEAIESSKFWKIRTFWFRLKQVWKQ